MLTEKKYFFSRWLTLGPWFLVILGLFASEFFQKNQQSLDLTKIYTNPISLEMLSDLEKIRLKNRFGEFEFQRQTNDEWGLINPKMLEARKEVISKLLTGLQNLQIMKLLPYDQINRSNFSLDRPALSLELTRSKNIQLLMDIGLYNPIDNTAYVYFHDEQTIYQIKTPQLGIEGLDLTGLIEDRIFPNPASDWSEISLYQGQSRMLLWQLKKSDSPPIQWSSKPSIPTDKIDSTLQELEGLKASLILDDLTPAQIEDIAKALDRPVFSFNLLFNREQVEIKITSIPNSLVQLKIDKKTAYLIWSSRKRHPMVINKLPQSVPNLPR